MSIDPKEQASGREVLTSHFSAEQLTTYLETQHKLTPEEIKAYRDHLAVCRDCWLVWNQVRWNAAQKGQSYQELKEYLGPSFQEYFDSSWALANEWNAKQPSTPQEVSEFYK